MQKPGFNICVGPDIILLKEHIASLLAKYPPASGSWVQYSFWGDEPLAAPFWEKLTLQGLFAEPRVIVLRNAQNVPAETLKKLSAALAKVGKDIWPFLCFEVEQEKGKFKMPAHVLRLQCLSFAQKQGWYAEIPALTARSLSAFIKTEAEKNGLILQGQDLELISRSVPPDAGAIRLEMQKLALASSVSDGGKLSPEALDLLNYEKDIDIFAFLQGLQSAKNPAEIWAQFLKDSGSSSDAGLFGFIGMLLREARILWQVLGGEQVFLPSTLIGGKKAMASRLGYNGLAQIWQYALKADMGVKTGEHSPHQAFERLIAELFSLFNR